MNTVQRNYLEAKAVKDAADKAEAELEKSLLKKYGRKEKYIREIKDIKVYTEIKAEFNKANTGALSYSDYCNFKRAERELIDWALTYVPEALNVPHTRFDDKTKTFCLRWGYYADIIRIALQFKA